MHLLLRETRALDEAAPAEDLAHAPAALLALSFSDADLAALGAAHAAAPGLPSLRLAPLGRLRHPLSVDLYLENTARHARCIVLRLLGGLEYWRYGAEELAALCRAQAIPLAVLPGEAREDPALAALSTVPPESYALLDACLRHGGRANMGRALQAMAHLAGHGTDLPDAAEPMPEHGIHALDPPGEAPLAAIVFYRSHLLSEDIAPIEALAAALRARGMAVGALYAGSLKAPETAAFVARTLRAWRPATVLNATGFAARLADAPSPLEAADAPVLQLVLAGSSRDAWLASTRGLTPSDLAMQLVMPELDGRLATTAISFKAEREGRAYHAPEPEGVALAADRAAGWARLRAMPRAGRRLAIVLSDYPGAGGRAGHAVGLDGWASLAAITALLAGAGYDTAPFGDATDALCHGAPVPILSLGEYRTRFAALPDPLQRAVLAAWGPPESDPAVQDGAFTHRVLRHGRVTAALQPPRGGDRKQAYHDPDLPPRHGYIAFYLALEVDALIHLGTHGSLEWLPGKAAALGPECWPRALTSGLPVVYPFIVNNPGEAAAAKRRLGAVTIGHLTPPLQTAGLHGEAAALERLIDEFAAADGMDRRRTALLRREITSRAAAAGLLEESGVAPDAPEEEALAGLDAYLCDVKDMQIRDGLHVYGTDPDPARLAGLPPGTASCAAAERAGLLAALDGRFVPPGPAGAPSAGRADVLPTGRNLAGVDPRTLPTPAALALAERTAAELLTRHRQEHGDWPRALVLNVWGAAAMRTGGHDIALALLLLGARPVWDGGSGRVRGSEIIPAAALDRPRVDVTLRISGLFRDAFAAQVTLFEQAVAAVADRGELAGPPGSRVFGPPPGQYGAGEDWLAASAAPADRALLADRLRVADAFLHVQDHAEGDLLDGPEHAAHLGGFAAAARALGAAPALWHHDGRLRTLAEQVRRAVRGRAANPRWMEGMMRHGYAGAAQVADAVDALAAFATTLPDRFDRQFDLLHAATLGDEATNDWLRSVNPDARQAIAARFEAMRAAGLWHSRRNDT